MNLIEIQSDTPIPSMIDPDWIHIYLHSSLLPFSDNALKTLQ